MYIAVEVFFIFRIYISICISIMLICTITLIKNWHFITKAAPLPCVGQSMLWSHVSLIYNKLCYQCLPPLNVLVRIPLIERCTRHNKSDLHEITILLLKVALSTMTPTLTHKYSTAKIMVNSHSAQKTIRDHDI
jgi:hypothetical protein